MEHSEQEQLFGELFGFRAGDHVKIRCNRSHGDGYGIGDRLLEDVWFEVTIDGKKLRVQVDPDAKDYFEQFDEKLWYDKVKDETRKGYAECPQCHEEVKLIP